MSKLEDIDNTTFMDSCMISKLISNLLASSNKFYLVYESIAKDDQNLSNLKLCLRIEEYRILLQTKNDLITKSKVFYSERQ